MEKEYDEQYLTKLVEDFVSQKKLLSQLEARVDKIKKEFDDLMTNLFQIFIKDEKKTKTTIIMTYKILYKIKYDITTSDNLLKLFEESK